MAQQKYESGWGNPDNHPPITAVSRPMFDPEGNPTDHAPEPEPAPELDAFLRPGDVQPSVQPLRLVPPAPEREHAEIMDDFLLLEAARGKITKIRSLASHAVESPSPAAWAVALDEIMKEIDR